MTLPLRFWLPAAVCLLIRLHNLQAQPQYNPAADFTFLDSTYSRVVPEVCILGSGPIRLVLEERPVVTQGSGRLEFSGFLFPFSRFAEALQFMQHYSFEKHVTPKGKIRMMPVREVAAWVTDQGVLVQPWNGKLVDKHGKVIAGYAANHVDLKNSTGTAYNNFLPFDADNHTVMFEGRMLRVLAQIHTHPVILPASFATRERDLSTTRELGIPVFAIEQESIIDVHGNYCGSIKSQRQLQRLVDLYSSQ